MALVPRGSLTVPSEVRIFQNAGAPVNGTSGTYAGVAEAGALLVDKTNFVLYLNKNTQASPTWVSQANSTGIFTGAGAPTDGTTGATLAFKGSLYIDTTNAALYINTNTLASPTWTAITIP